jgi:twitching motility protein PilT
MRLTPAIRNMIRDNKVHQIEGVVSSSAQSQMHSMDQSLLQLYKKGIITCETALKFATNADMLKRKF